MVSSGERAVFADVREVAEANGCTIHLSTKLSDVVDPRDVPPDLFDWATRAHIDLLVRADDDQLTPLFAIEVDGSHHLHDPRQIRRDRAKDQALAVAGVDRMRIAGDTIDRTNGRERLSSYLAELWFSARSFHHAQDEGIVGRFEVFMPALTFHFNREAQGMECLDPTMSIRAQFFRDHDLTGVPLIPVPQSWYRYDDDYARVRVKTILALTEEQFIGCEIEIGDFRIPGVPPADVAEELALAELSQLLRCWHIGHAVAMRSRQLDHWLPSETTPLGEQGGWRPDGWGGPMPQWLAASLSEERVQSLGYRVP